jgi:O-antigen/teichoic acid export membrane protein
VATGLGALTAVVTVAALGLGAATAGAFALALVAWVWEEFGRRLLVTRLEFWKLAANDLCYAGVTMGVVAVLAFGLHNLTLTTLLLAMAVGSTASFVLAVVQLPRAEFARPSPTKAAVRRLNQFAAWRALQTTIRPLSMSVIRIAVAAVATAAALGQLEGARILATPMTTLISGAATFLLPKMAAEERGESGGERLPVVKWSLLLGGASLAVGLVCTLLVPVLAPLLLGDKVQVDQLAALFWALFAAAFGLGIPLGNALVARQQARLTFWIRAVDAIVGVGLATLLAWAVTPSWAPLGLTVGALFGAYLCWYSLRRVGRV